MPRRSRKSLFPEIVTHSIESLSHDGRGITRINGKTVFVWGGLPGESVQFRYLRKRGKFDEAQIVEVLEPAPTRRAALCPHFSQCGGCSLQHIELNAQIQFKQKAFAELLQQAKVTPAQWLPPLLSPPWGYRRKARLGVKFVAKKNRLIIGFRERQGHLIADTRQCEVLIPAVGKRLAEFADLIGEFSIRDKIPQLEIAAGDNVCAVIIRHLEDFAAQDLSRLREFAKTHQLQIYLQAAGIDSIRLFYSPVNENLYYRLARYQLKLEFQPWQFIQINAEVNKAMVDRAIELLDCQSEDRILDLFCGIGNFTLPIAQFCSHVTGVEAEKAAVLQAIHNAKLNGISNCCFFEADLFQTSLNAQWAQQTFNKVLIDPPRTGAEHIIDFLEKWRPTRIVYVSCDLATLARDSAKLVKQGYQLFKTGLMDMFPHTQHAEAIALFVKD